MKLAAPLPLNKKRDQWISEYNIDFHEGHKEDQLLYWLDNNQTKRVNIRIVDIIPSIDFFTQLKKYDFVYIRIMHNQISNLVHLCQEAELRFFIDCDYVIGSFIRLLDVLNIGVTDVYIFEDLCYRLKRVREICDQYNVRIRLIPNLISSFAGDRGTDVTAPWYVPENFKYLDNFYDVIEFEFHNDWDMFDALLDIWTKDQEWKDNIQYINEELEIPVWGESFYNELCLYKTQCKHRCIEENSNCNKCQQYISIAQRMHDKNWKIVKRQEENLGDSE